MKRKFSLFLNVAVLALCVCAIAIGVYSAKQASLNVTGTIGFTAHNCDVDISGYIYGHSTGVDGEPIAKPTTDEQKQYLTYGTNTKATESAPLKISGTLDNALTFGNVYFSDMGDSGEVEPIIIELTITNISQFDVLLEDDTTVASGAGYTAVCSNPLHVLYLNTENGEETTTLQYILRPAKDSNGNYVNIDSPVSVTLNMNFSKINTDIVGNAADGWTVDDSGYLTAVPTKAQNNGSDTLIIPANVIKDGTTTQVYSIQNSSDTPITNISDYKKVIILEGVYNIGSSAFYNCSSLESIAIPSSVNNMYSSAFYNCSSLESIAIPSSVTSIDYYAFQGCTSLVSIAIPEGVTSIFGSAFQGCTSLVSIAIPSSVDSIDNTAFQYCTSLVSITFGANSQLTKINSYSFSGCSNLTSITIPSSVTIIDSSAFEYCRSLVSITFGANSKLTSIEYAAFEQCNSLVSITIPESVTSIASLAFYGCSSLTSIAIPSSVTSIDDFAFESCSSLTNVTFETTEGWWYSDDSSATSGTAISSANLADATLAATYLKMSSSDGGYADKYWKRG